MFLHMGEKECEKEADYFSFSRVKNNGISHGSEVEDYEITHRSCSSKLNARITFIKLHPPSSIYPTMNSFIAIMSMSLSNASFIIFFHKSAIKGITFLKRERNNNKTKNKLLVKGFSCACNPCRLIKSYYSIGTVEEHEL